MGNGKATTQYVALLRGINVGGSNIIKMDLLRACLEQSGFQHVTTYIQSGNVLFESDEQDQSKLERRIEQAISGRFKKDVSVLIRSRKQMKNIVSRAPKGFGTKPNAYRYDVIFLKAPLTAVKAMKKVSPKEGVPARLPVRQAGRSAALRHAGVDQAYAGNGMLYFSRLTSRAVQSRLSRISGTPEYKYMTIRNWNTTVKLLALMEERLR